MIVENMPERWVSPRVWREPHEVAFKEVCVSTNVSILSRWQ